MNFGDNHVFYFNHTYVRKPDNNRRTAENGQKSVQFHDNYEDHLFWGVSERCFCLGDWSFEVACGKSGYFSSIWAIRKHGRIVFGWSMVNSRQGTTWQKKLGGITLVLKYLSQAHFKRKFGALNFKSSLLKILLLMYKKELMKTKLGGSYRVKTIFFQFR